MAACTICARSKNRTQRPAGFLQLLTIPHCPWSHIAIDFVTGLPVSSGNCHFVHIRQVFKGCSFRLPGQTPFRLLSSWLTMSSGFMASFWRLFRNGDHSSPPMSGRPSALLWEPRSVSVLDTIHSPMARQRGSTRTGV